MHAFNRGHPPFCKVDQRLAGRVKTKMNFFMLLNFNLDKNASADGQNLPIKIYI